MMYFTFNGRSSKEFGITVGRRPERERAPYRLDIEEIEGLDGATYEELGYNTYVMDIMFYVEGKENLDKISRWLQGPGKLTRSDLPGRLLEVERQSPIVYTYLTEDLYQASTTFYVLNPFWTSEDEGWQAPSLISKNTYEIENGGTVYSQPLIRIWKKEGEEIDVTINDVRFLYRFDSSDIYVDIDCKEQKVYEGYRSKERQLIIGYKFPELKPGINKITVNKGDVDIEMRRVSAWK